MPLRPEDYGGTTDPLADFANTSTMPGRGAGKAIDPSKPSLERSRPTADRIAELELEREINRLEQLLEARQCSCIGCEIDRSAVARHRAELARLRNEQPKGGAQYSCMCGAGDKPCPGPDGRPLCDAPSPAPSPEPQDVRGRVLTNFEIRQPDADGIVWLVFHGHGTAGKGMVSLGAKERVVAQVALHLEEDRQAALAQSDAQPRTNDDHEMGRLLGYEQAVQHVDEETGGDGEYCYSTLGAASERHCPDAPAMIQRIIDRFEALKEKASAAPPDASGLVEAAEWRFDIDNAPEHPEACWVGDSKSGVCIVCRRGRRNMRGVWYIAWADKMLPWQPDCWMPIPPSPPLRSRAADRSAPRSDKGGA